MRYLAHKLWSTFRLICKFMQISLFFRAGKCSAERTRHHTPPHKISAWGLLRFTRYCICTYRQTDGQTDRQTDTRTTKWSLCLFLNKVQARQKWDGIIGLTRKIPALVSWMPTRLGRIHSRYERSGTTRHGSDVQDQTEEVALERDEKHVAAVNNIISSFDMDMDGVTPDSSRQNTRTVTSCESYTLCGQITRVCTFRLASLWNDRGRDAERNRTPKLYYVHNSSSAGPRNPRIGRGCQHGAYSESGHTPMRKTSEAALMKTLKVGVQSQKLQCYLHSTQS